MNKRQAAAEQICSTLRRRGFRALLAGGCVRDMLLKTPPRDFDIATNARPFEVAQLFERTIDIGAAFGVQVVLLPEGPFEVTTFRKDGPYHDGRHPCSVAFTGEEEDARRRDFTINALFYDPVDRKVLDYVGGLDDLRTGLVRAVGVPRERFEEDHLRLLRAIRFAARLRYAIERETYQAIRESAPRITLTSAERIRDELLKMLTEGGTRRAFEMLDDTGLLHQILPEVSAMKGVAQPPEFHPEGDVFTHTLLMLDLLNHPSAALALGVLLHDAGKPATQTRTDRIRFNDHDKAGAIIAREVCERLRLPRRDTERVVWLVAQHMRFQHIPKMRESKRKRTIRADGFEELKELCRIDCLASHGNLDTVVWVENYQAQLPPESLRPEPLVQGNDLIALGYPPGPLFSKILKHVEDLQLDGRLTTPDEARAFILAHWPRERQARDEGS
ncbi:MAG TPA: CCA tRNA nucleotidyltransferase [Candidatus Hydrogenedentes bacterium]|jgi:poly(A) polymerase|nr:CCA tRNA nucleotidyltransferase [Candidatus Hydrogenedentota bacterium]MDY0031124.1 CCA tRNA nucleotidyltransferase [FCB group bacterium]HNZ19253.1 CCA tRNA nucleotidyltransferase [Candidatus Hydrogenedentota bacterium]HOH33770.1 CCA tRNA nucleotidyltransferase [Candidatus Hydrogenedentota bacterium]HPA06175.1 CCA tRNA nucleotidyltransferase [Candidatus Hydrogenedentota bacterium]